MSEYYGTGFVMSNGIALTRVNSDGEQLIMMYHKWDKDGEGSEKYDGIKDGYVRDKMTHLMSEIFKTCLSMRLCDDAYTCDSDMMRRRLHELVGGYMCERFEGGGLINEKERKD